MFDHLSNVTRWLGDRIGISGDAQLRIIATLIVLVSYAIVVRLARRLAQRTVADVTSRYWILKASSYALGLIAVAILFRVWAQGVTGIATYLGLLSAGIAVALQDPLINLAGWLFVVTRRPFEVGDRIEIGTHAGDVVDIRIFQFTLLEIGNWVAAEQSTGRVVHVPNGWVFKHPVANYDKGFRYVWHEIPVVVTFESDWRLAKDVLLRICTERAEHLSSDATRRINEAAERYRIRLAKLTPVVWTSAVDHGVRLTMRYLCKPRERRVSEHVMWEAILTEFAKLDDVDLAYPTTRFFDNPREGKRPRGAPVAPSEAAPGVPVEGSSDDPLDSSGVVPT